MGIDMVITHKAIIKLLRTPNSGRFIIGTKDNSHKQMRSSGVGLKMMIIYALLILER